MGLLAVDPIEPAEICARFDVSLIPMSALDCDCSWLLGGGSSVFSAVTVPCAGRTAIVHNDAHHPHRQRSNICHELAHLFLGHECVPPLTSEGERVHDGVIEAEANFLAGLLLVPNEAAIHIVRNGLISVAQRIYGVSRPMLDFRLRVSGAIAIQRRRAASVSSLAPGSL